jgi:hypothetical protein
MKINYKSYYILLSLLIIVLLFGYREFLELYKAMLTEFVGYYKYQKIIIYYETGNQEFMDYFPMNVRFLGLFLQYIVFKIVPCLTFPSIEIKNNVHELYECATFSLSLVNYVSKYVGLLLTIIYIYIKKKCFIEISVASILFVLLINLVESSTLDRVAICYIILILISLNNTKYSVPLLYFSFLVNEKVVLIFGLILFFQLFYYKNKDKIFEFVAISCSVISYIIMIFILYNYFNFKFFYYPGLENNDYLKIFKLLLSNPLNASYFTNAYAPIFISILPFFIFMINKKKFNYDFSILYFIPIILLFLLGYIGIENIGRYVMHMFPLWLPILSSQIVYYLKLNRLDSKEK